MIFHPIREILFVGEHLQHSQIDFTILAPGITLALFQIKFEIYLFGRASKVSTRQFDVFRQLKFSHSFGSVAFLVYNFREKGFILYLMNFVCCRCLSDAGCIFPIQVLFETIQCLTDYLNLSLNLSNSCVLVQLCVYLTIWLDCSTKQLLCSKLSSCSGVVAEQLSSNHGAESPSCNMLDILGFLK